MIRKYYILALMLCCLLCGQTSYGQSQYCPKCHSHLENVLHFVGTPFRFIGGLISSLGNPGYNTDYRSSSSSGGSGSSNDSGSFGWGSERTEDEWGDWVLENFGGDDYEFDYGEDESFNLSEEDLNDYLNEYCNIYPSDCTNNGISWYLDKDGDGWHSETNSATASPGIGWVQWVDGTSNGLDCDDTLPEGIYAQADCTKITWVIDIDDDKYYVAGSELLKYTNWTPTTGYTKKENRISGDCDDSPTGGNVHQLNKCGKCEVEPVTGSCNDRDCIENNTSNPENIKPSEAKLSQNAINLLKAIETLSLVIYDDATGKPTTKYVKGATIGYGHLITDEVEFEKYKNGISESSANTLFTNDIDREIKSVRKLSYDLSQNQFDALAIMVFNIGTQFNSSSLRKFLEDCNAKTNYSSVENAWKAFNKDNGVLLQGLINRRQCEWDIFVNGIYKQW